MRIAVPRDVPTEIEPLRARADDPVPGGNREGRLHPGEADTERTGEVVPPITILEPGFACIGLTLRISGRPPALRATRAFVSPIAAVDRDPGPDDSVVRREADDRRCGKARVPPFRQPATPQTGLSR